MHEIISVLIPSLDLLFILIQTKEQNKSADVHELYSSNVFQQFNCKNINYEY